MTGSAEWFRAPYASAFQDHLVDGSETTLQAAYELGREAVRRELGVLDLAAVHHEVLAAALSHVFDGGEVQRVVQSAGSFFLETVSAFEMVQRGFIEARDAVVLERTQAQMLRQLSSFLGDASIALNASDSIEELLQLVAEQARELTKANCCFATVALAKGSGTIHAASYPETDARWATFLQSRFLSTIAARVRPERGSLRLRRDEFADHPAGRSLAERSVPIRGLGGWLVASLTALDGREVGAIHVVDKDDGDFSDLDEAVLVHLAQMASAAVERAQLYEPPR